MKIRYSFLSLLLFLLLGLSACSKESEAPTYRYNSPANYIVDNLIKVQEVNLDAFTISHDGFAYDDKAVFSSMYKIPYETVEERERLEQGYIDFVLNRLTPDVLKQVDRESLSILNALTSWVMVDKNHVYIEGKIASHIDAASFQALSRLFYKDKNNIYFLEGNNEDSTYIFSQADYSSFEVLSSVYSKDKNNVYKYRWISEKFLDPASFKVINEWYLLDKFGAYYEDYPEPLPIPAVDYQTFSAFNQYYAYDKENVYYIDSLVEQAAPQSFEVIEGALGKDANHLYYHGEIVDGADPNTFKILSAITTEDDLLAFSLDGNLGQEPINHSRYFSDKNQIYYESRATIGGDLSPLPKADSATFQQLTSNYGKDKNQVYYTRWVIDGADPETFEVIALSSHFARDKNHVYQGSSILKNADSKTFKLYEGGTYSKDEQHVFYGDNLILGANAASFERISNPKDYLNIYAKDNKHVYFQNNQLDNADHESFTVIGYGFSKDNRFVYFKESPFEEIDAASFTIVSGCTEYSNFKPCITKDKNHLYTATSNNYGVINNVDLESFEVLSDEFAKDKNNAYYWDFSSGWYIALKGADVATFRSISSSYGVYGKDSQQCYFREEAIPCPKED